MPDELADRWQRLNSTPPSLEDVPLHWLRARGTTRARRGTGAE